MKSMKNLNRREHLRPTFKYTLGRTWLAKPTLHNPRVPRDLLCALGGFFSASSAVESWTPEYAENRRGGRWDSPDRPKR